MNLSKSVVMVTGSAGFLGQHVYNLLDHKCKRLVPVPSKTFRDLRKEDDLTLLLGTYEPDIIIHLAANCGGIGYNQKHPGKLFYDNAIMGIQLIEAARQFGVKKFVCIGTVCAYPKNCPTPFSEDDLWSGFPEETNAAYGLAKKMLLVQLQAYRQEYGFSSVYLLPANLYGPNDHFDDQRSHVIPALIKRMGQATRRNEPSVQLWGSGAPTREFLYVEDCAQAIMAAAEAYDSPEPLNLGTGQEISIARLAELVAFYVGYKGKIEWDKTKPDGQPRRCLDVHRARKHLGWTATTSLESGLRKTIQWYQENMA